MAAKTVNRIVKASQVKDLLVKGAIPIDSTWYLPNVSRNPWEEFNAKRLPRARFFDLDKVKAESPYPHMLPNGETWSTAMRQMGIDREDEVIVYDTSALGLFSAPRVYWMFKVFGHPKAHLLNSYAQYDGPFEHGPYKDPPPTMYPVVEPSLDNVTTYEELMTLIQNRANVQLLDARPAGRFHGTDAEPREGLPSGHIPGSISTPFSDFIDAETKTLKDADALKAYFEEKGVDFARPIIAQCGSGVTACIVDTALETVGVPQNSRRVYDGSWTEFAMRTDPSSGLIVKSDLKEDW